MNINNFMNSSNNTNNHNPLIENANQYTLVKKFITINSEDRDTVRYPNSSNFEISLPQDYKNIVSAKLYNWSFPANYSLFSESNLNISMSFKFTDLYNPNANNNFDTLENDIYTALAANLDTIYVIDIEPGFYTPTQMQNELTNKFNEIVTNTIRTYFNDNSSQFTESLELFEEYRRFVIVYNEVNQTLWFGNNADNFMITNEYTDETIKDETNKSCVKRNLLPDRSNWGLPAYLGFSRDNIEGAYSETNPLPRFYYGSPNNGYWCVPILQGAKAYTLQAPYKINFMGPSHIYMDIPELNCIDETSPYSTNLYTRTTNTGTSIVNACFSKIPIPTTPISQWFDGDLEPYKYFNPPLETLRKIQIKIRYHNGQLVDFGLFNYSFMIQLNILLPTQNTIKNVVTIQ